MKILVTFLSCLSLISSQTNLKCSYPDLDNFVLQLTPWANMKSPNMDFSGDYMAFGNSDTSVPLKELIKLNTQDGVSILDSINVYTFLGVAYQYACFTKSKIEQRDNPPEFQVQFLKPVIDGNKNFIKFTFQFTDIVKKTPTGETENGSTIAETTMQTSTFKVCFPFRNTGGVGFPSFQHEENCCDGTDALFYPEVCKKYAKLDEEND